MSSGYQECGGCHTRILTVRGGVPALDWSPDPAGWVAVTITDPRTGRWLARGDDATRLEHRHNVHVCKAVAEPEPTVQRHADHGPEVTCRPAGHGLCEPASGGQLQPWRDALDGAR